MSRFNDDDWGDSWDFGGVVSPDLIAWPLKRILKKECEKLGIDTNNPERVIATTVASSVLASFVGALVGGPAGLLAGVLGYGMGMSATYPSDQSQRGKSSMKSKEAMLLQAGKVACLALQEKVSKSTWNDICDEVQAAIEPYVSGGHPEPEPVESIRIIYDAMYSVNPNAAKQWLTILYVGAEQLGIE
jgi:hypothetical protein